MYTFVQLRTRSKNGIRDALFILITTNKDGHAGIRECVRRGQFFYCNFLLFQVFSGVSPVAVFRVTNSRPREAKQSVHLLNLALTELWPIDAAKKEEMIEEMMGIVRDPLVPSITRTMAAAVLVKMGANNIKALTMVATAMGNDAPVEVAPTVVSREDLAEGVRHLLGNDLVVTRETA